ncbi:VOC family protein [Paraburkholderia sacchari]|uniref:VOC family protein n=1 Tax=Paraburkholderia sacchari TaxID=159450 RepID=UPI003D9981FF
MPLLDIHHIALRCKPGNLEETTKFYTELLGMKEASRPNLGFPGSWLDINKTMFHIVDHRPAKHLDPWHQRHEADAMFDHIAVKAHGFDEIRERLIQAGADWRQLDLRSAGLWQLFVLDPNGIIVELNFTITDEPPGSKGPDGTRGYMLHDTYDKGVVQGDNVRRY